LAFSDRNTHRIYPPCGNLQRITWKIVNGPRAGITKIGSNVKKYFVSYFSLGIRGYLLANSTGMYEIRRISANVMYFSRVSIRITDVVLIGHFQYENFSDSVLKLYYTPLIIRLQYYIMLTYAFYSIILSNI